MERRAVGRVLAGARVVARRYMALFGEEAVGRPRHEQVGRVAYESVACLL